MLRIFDRDPTEPSISRRELLTVGAVGALSWSRLVSSLPAAEAKTLTGKSVIFIFQQGGPSQHETLDPKLEAPESVRTVTGAIPTRIPGVRFGEALPRLAQRADRLNVIRSYQTNNAGHNIRPLVGPESLEANIGAHYARAAGATRPLSGMPTTAVLYPRAVDAEVPGPSARGNLKATGPYPSAFAPFVPGAGGQLQDDMELHLPKDRFLGDRRALLRALDQLKSQADASGPLQSFDAVQQQAIQLLLGGGVSQALDLSREDPRTVEKYDTRHFVRSHHWERVNRGKRGYYTAHAKTLGKLLLLARRLCEAGCGFVTVHAGYAGVWDMHADGNNLNMVDGMQAIGYTFDHAVAALIDDLESRGLQDQVLVVACGEMGRTPRVNQRGGRDHWAKLAPLLLYGGGYESGRVIGQSNRAGGEPASDPLNPQHLISTILRTTLNITELRLVSSMAPQVGQLAEHPPLPL